MGSVRFGSGEKTGAPGPLGLAYSSRMLRGLSSSVSRLVSFPTRPYTDTAGSFVSATRPYSIGPTSFFISATRPYSTSPTSFFTSATRSYSTGPTSFFPTATRPYSTGPTSLTHPLLPRRDSNAQTFLRSPSFQPALIFTSAALVRDSQSATYNMPGTLDRRCDSCGSPHRKLSTEHKTPFMIGVAGGTASAKSTVCKIIIDRLGQTKVNNLDRQVVTMSQDAFYRELNEQESVLASKGKFNFDHPDAFDNVLMEACLNDIMLGRPTKIPVYDFKTNSRVADEFTTIYPSDVVIVEGILIFYHAKMRDLFNLKLFVDADADIRLMRRVQRDISERGRDLETVLNQYSNLVKPAFEEFCIPTKKFADVIVPRGAENNVAIDLIVQHIQDIICRSNGGSKNGSPLSRSCSNSESLIR